MDKNTDLLTMNHMELVKWCKERKNELGYTNAYIAERCNIPKGTIDRLFSGHYTSFRYDTIQPLLSFLLGVNEETPAPEENNPEQGEYYFNTIEGMKMVLVEKAAQIDLLKAENSDKAKRIRLLTWITIVLGALLVISLGLFAAFDLTNPEFGFIYRK